MMNKLQQQIKIDRPERALEKQAIDDFMKRNPMAGGGMLVQPGFDGTRQGYAKPQFRDKNAIKLQNWIKENPDFEYNKFNAMEIAKKAGIKESDLSLVHG
jgi:hypothetical protein